MYLAYARKDARNNKALPSFDVYAATQQRLEWAHGELKAALILKGVDPLSNDDLERWRRLGRRV